MESLKDILKNYRKPERGEPEVAPPIKELPKEFTFKSMFITGRPGVGKTYKANEILETNIEYQDYLKKVNADFSSSEGARLFKSYNCGQLMFYARDARRGNEFFDEAVKMRGIILDDLGLGKRSDFIPDIIYLIIDERISRNKPTIVTSNLSIAEIAEQIDDRLASRLASFEIIELKGKDRRLLKK